MDIAGLKYVLAVAEAGSFSAAARQLNLHASTLSRHVFVLEEELGTTIFEREHSGVRLTSCGREILVYARQALADLEALTNVAQSGDIGKRGHVRLGVHIPPICDALRELLFRWRQFHPNVGLLLCEQSDDELCNAIRERHLDAALIAEPALAPDLVCEPICTEHLWVCRPRRSEALGVYPHFDFRNVPPNVPPAARDAGKRLGMARCRICHILLVFLKVFGDVVRQPGKEFWRSRRDSNPR
jgi:DNA-binding transcriptional LysR family regulator